MFKNIKKIKNILEGGSNLHDEHEKLKIEVDELRTQNANYVVQLAKAENELIKIRKKRATQLDLETYNYNNLENALKIFKSTDDKIDDEVLELATHEPIDTSFDLNQNKIVKYNGDETPYYRSYQTEFIKNWSVSAQEVVILYYGVGTGKTIISVNCAEKFLELNSDASVYFILPASLVINMIKTMLVQKINPWRKHEDGSFCYYFISYQQLLRSKFIFKANSCIIVDEAHNLRNIKTKDEKQKKSGRKYEKTGKFGLLGNKLSKRLFEHGPNFLRCIFMTGTLFVNSSEDIEGLISIGYKKVPYLNSRISDYEEMLNNNNAFDNYYRGLISYQPNPFDDPEYPMKKFHVIPIPAEGYNFDDYDKGEDAYFYKSRNQGMLEKCKWIIKFLENNKNKKTLIYSQYLGVSIVPLVAELKKTKIKWITISGENSKKEKEAIIHGYNTGSIDVLIFTLSIKEGISFLETNNFIVIAPYWNYSIMEQIMARGIRFRSHKLKNKVTVNLYMLVAAETHQVELINFWAERLEEVLDKNIHTFTIPIKKVEVDKKIRTELDFGLFAQQNDLNSRDIFMYNSMVRKQTEINGFENRIIDFPEMLFEHSTTVENNEFIKAFNNDLLIVEKERLELHQSPLSTKEIKELKKVVYSAWFKAEIIKTSSKIPRFNDPTVMMNYTNQIHFAPDLSSLSTNTEKIDIVNEIVEQIRKGTFNLDKTLKKYLIDPKKTITQFQANFTPDIFCETIVKLSGIEKDTRTKIMVLEPTAGIGNILRPLVSLENRENFFIDSNEFNNLFFQIGKGLYKDIDNIKWLNTDFLQFNKPYNYDYILGNPPFSLPYRIKVEDGHISKKDLDLGVIQTYKTKDTTIYDVQFVERCYNMLSDNGILCMIISDRYLHNKNIATPLFATFLQYVERIKKLDETAYHYTKTGDFQKSDKNFSKLMETSFPMVCIYLKKIPYFVIKLNQPLEKIIKVSKPRKLKETATQSEKNKYNEKLKIYEDYIKNSTSEIVAQNDDNVEEEENEKEEEEELNNDQSTNVKIKKIKHHLNKGIDLQKFYDLDTPKAVKEILKLKNPVKLYSIIEQLQKDVAKKNVMGQKLLEVLQKRKEFKALESIPMPAIKKPMYLRRR